MKQVPSSLRTWFIVHCIVDIIFGVPLLLVPIDVLSLFGFMITETITARLVGAALLALGGISFIARASSRETYKTLLTMKIIWSLGAILGIYLSIQQGAPKTSWLFLLIFAVFAGIWIHYRRKI